jgi:hypothetical protein
MVVLYFLTGNAIDKMQNFKSWEDAYMFVTDYATAFGYEMTPDGAVKKETNQLLKIFR